MKRLEDDIKIADIHADRLTYAAKQLADYLPISAERLQDLSYEDIMKFDFYTGRFAKLQDQLGHKAFASLLKAVEDIDESMTFIERLNILAKLGIVSDVEEWSNLRNIRNHISHDYPDDFEDMAKAINQSYEARFVLLDCLKRVHEMIEKLKNLR